MRGFDTLMASLQIDHRPLLSAAGIPEIALTDDEWRVSLVAYSHLLEMAATVSGQDDLGMQMADHQDISVLGPLAIAMQNAATIGQGLEVCSRFMHTHSPGIQLDVRPQQQDTVILRLNLLVPSWHRNTQLVEQCMADLHHFLGLMSHRAVPIISVRLPHEQCAEDAQYRRAFGCLPSFQHTQAELHLPNEFMAHDLGEASESLHKLSIDYLQLRYDDDAQSVTAQVEAILSRALASTGGRRDHVAGLLRMHPRTMLRRLAEEGTTFKAILDEARQTACRRWLCETTTPLAQIPPMLGLADQAVMSRCCRRWFGTTPGQLRATASRVEFSS